MCIRDRINGSHQYQQPSAAHCWHIENSTTCQTDSQCQWIDAFESCEPINPACAPPPMPDSLPFKNSCGGPSACNNPKACLDWCALQEDPYEGPTGGDGVEFNIYGEGGYGLCIDTPYWVDSNDFWHRDNPTSPFYWKNIIPEGYDTLNLSLIHI